MADTNLNAYFPCGNSQPVITPNSASAAGPSTALRVDIAHIHSLGPVTRIIHHERVEIFLLHGMLKRTFLIAFNLTHFQRVGLPHNNENFDRFGHVSRFAIRIRQFG